MKHLLLALTIAAALACVPASAGAAVIEDPATDLGGSVWQYDYYVADATFTGLRQGFAVFFDESSYADLALVLPTPADWDLLVKNPDVVNGSPGYFDALALVDSPVFVGPFSVTFTWLGVGAPGAQPFEKYTLDASGAPVPDVDGTGDTVPLVVAVPEPATLVLLAVAIAAGALRRRRALLPSDRS